MAETKNLAQTAIFEDLRDGQFVSEYLTDCLSEGAETFRLGLNNALEANGEEKITNEEPLQHVAVTEALNKLGLEMSFQVQKSETPMAEGG